MHRLSAWFVCIYQQWEWRWLKCVFVDSAHQIYIYLFTLPTKYIFIYSAHQQVTERARSASDNSFYHFKATFVIFSRLHLSMTTVQCSGSRAVGSVCQCLIVYSTTPLQYNSLKRETERGQLQLFDLTAFVDQHIVKAAQWVKCGGKVEVAQMFVFALHPPRRLCWNPLWWQRDRGQNHAS